MGKQRDMTWAEAANEVSHIQAINPRFPGTDFNHDPECFARYRRMQSNHARNSGHGMQANQMVMRGSWPQVSKAVDAILHR